MKFTTRPPRGLLFLVLPGLLSCKQRTDFPPITQEDSLAIVRENLAFRITLDDYYRSNPNSPFMEDTNAVFTGLRWFPVDIRFRGLSSLHHYERPESVTVVATGGEERRQLMYGYFEFPVPDTNGNPLKMRLNVYKFAPYGGGLHSMNPDELNVWFTDETNGDETYHVGRYINIEPENADPDHLYVIDLNKAYNPYCAYSDLYSCAVPRKEDHVPVQVRAGEMDYHPEARPIASEAELD